MKKIVFILLICFNVLHSQNTARTFKSYHDNKSGIVHIKTNDGTYRLQIISPKVIETSFIPSGEQYIDSSHALISKPQYKQYSIKHNPHTLEINTNGLNMVIEKSPFQIKYFYQKKWLVSENLGYIKTDSTEILDFSISSTEALMGGGARVLGMNRRGHRLALYNKAHYGYETHSSLMNYTMPLVFSSKLYAIHFDNPSTGFLDLDHSQKNLLRYETTSGRKTYQVLAANNWYDLTNAYTSLTGKQPLPPRWALGNFASRFGYHSQREVEHTVALFNQNHIPLDAVILDIFWFGKDIKGHMGNLEFYKDSFPQPQKMISNFNNQQIKTILVTEPFILTTSSKWAEVSQQGFLGKTPQNTNYTYDFYFGNTGLIDLVNPQANQWFWNIYKNLTTMGVSGWWGDLGEPEVHPEDMIHYNGSTANEVHNVYGHLWAKMIHDGYLNDFKTQRPFILMRAGYSGSQRYGMIPWSGDVNRSWGGLQAQPEIALQMGIQGLSYMHSDLGGFAGGDTFDPELYIRWLQYGVFQPIYRPHAQEHIAPEPVFHDPNTLSMAKKAIELRYQLLPYNYTVAFENNQSGYPLMRPLFFEEPHNKRHFQNIDSYLWGKHFLVTPILKAEQKTVDTYFPKHQHWFNFYTDEVYRGGNSYTITTQPDHIPTFVRGGAFIPMIDVIQNTAAYDLSNLKLHYYYDPLVEESQDFLYFDDGLTPKSYEKGLHEILKFSAKANPKSIRLKISPEIGSQWHSSQKNIELIIHNISQEPIRTGGIPFTYHKKDKLLKLNINISNKSKSLLIKF